MTREELIDTIQRFIRENGSNEITATILRPILTDMVNYVNDVTGNLRDLATGEKENLVGALNAVLEQAQKRNNEIKIHTGNKADPAQWTGSYKTGDFYGYVSQGNIQGFWQYNGRQWVSVRPGISEADIRTIIVNEITSALSAGGIRKKVKTFSTGFVGKYEVTEKDEVLACYNTNFMWVELPTWSGIEASRNIGRTIFVKRVNGGVSVRNSSNRMITHQNTGDIGIEDGDMWQFVWDGQYWLANFQGRS